MFFGPPKGQLVVPWEQLFRKEKRRKTEESELVLLALRGDHYLAVERQQMISILHAFAKRRRFLTRSKESSPVLQDGSSTKRSRKSAPRMVGWT